MHGFTSDVRDLNQKSITELLTVITPLTVSDKELLSRVHHFIHFSSLPFMTKGTVCGN
jgi:hypothetical protein